MLLTIDVGNTNLVFGLFDANGALLTSWRYPTKPLPTPDQLGSLVLSELEKAAVQPNDIPAMVVASVVPAIAPALAGLAERHGWQLMASDDPDTDLGIFIDVEAPEEVGADRLVNALAAKALGLLPAIIVDFGTATTFDLVLDDKAGQPVYAGGIIAPGVNLSVEALSRAAAKLPEMDIQNWQPAAVPVPGKSTEQAMRAGILWGYAGLADGLIQRLHIAAGGPVPVIATGGLASLFAPHISAVSKVVPDLTLQGLWQIYQMNRKS